MKIVCVGGGSVDGGDILKNKVKLHIILTKITKTLLF